MRSGLVKWYAAAFAAVALMRPAFAEEVAFGKKNACPPACPCPAPVTIPAAPTTDPTPAPTPMPEPTPPPAAQEPSVDPLAFGATGGGESFAAVSSAVGYIDPALPISQVRLRSDFAYDSNRPDRAEFFYAKCGCLAAPPFNQVNSKGPPLPETAINSYQEVNSYIEYAFVPRFSAFVEVPYRFLNPQVNANTNGIGDMNAGFKYAWIYDRAQILTTQLRVYAPTGRAEAGLGTHHASIEPSLLFYQRLTERANLEAEFRDWIPVGGSDFAGNIVRYGVGVNYMVWGSENVKVFPVAEFVGWTVLGGQQSTPLIPIQGAAGDTIVNAKFGVRTQLGKPVGNGLMSRADVYAGYGRALTGEVWYKDVIRLELRVRY